MNSDQAYTTQTCTTQTYAYKLVTSPITGEQGFDEPLQSAAEKIFDGVDALTGWGIAEPLSDRASHERMLTPRDEKIFDALGIVLCNL